MITVERFIPEDLAEMAVQPVQRELGSDPIARGRLLSLTGRCFTVRAGGAPIFCGGVTITHSGYATMWSAFALDAGPEMLAITRRTLEFIKRLDFKRIDAVVHSDHRAGHRWVFRLGFAPEARLNDYFEDGGDAVIYRLKR